ncbi:MAG: L-threonylcarbamoyladenylate synthase [Deinococcus sp.]|uniref:L-threonylcarbamoyladenylate synthase n=1 Tax=Deinococcus sp. TaxID=47478 RepID=UPI0026DD848F|nr:L-threonylcarbamoyladenylate synthase [Deinococcus sp.]MDO4245991.1 L-threonylcarbamoyladenylate synthase [Deinococcus sp.]
MSDFPSVSDLLADALRVLDAGGVVAYPTETVWGLAARPHFAAELYARKGREDTKPLQVSCPDPASALALAQPNRALDTLSRVWPGPLTVIAPARPEHLPGWGAGASAVAPDGWVGLRVPAQATALALLRRAGPLATTSLNPSGQPAATTQAQAAAYGLADLLLPGEDAPAGQPGHGQPSTVVRLPDGERPAEVLRQGAVGVEELRAWLAPLGLAVVVQ